MARGFKNTPRGYTAYFEKPELLLIRDLAEDIVALLQPPGGGGVLREETSPALWP